MLMSATPSNLAGQLDTSFATNGLAKIVVPGHQVSEITCVIAAPDGSIYFTGVCGSHELVTTEYFLGRLKPNGELDDSFGVDGLVLGEVSDKFFSGKHSIRLQRDGKIVWSGLSFPSASLTALTFARYETNGKLDSSFGTGGSTTVDIVLSPPAGLTSNPLPTTQQKREPWPTSLASGSAAAATTEILPDGKILACKVHQFDGDTAHSLIIRLTKDGGLDTSFASKGYVVVYHPQHPLGRTALHGLLVQPDGKYLCCGSVRPAFTTTLALFVRYNPDGRPDSGFGTGGMATMSGRDPNISHVIQQPNQNFVGIGNTMSMPYSGVMIGINADGSPDTQFNGGNPKYENYVPGLENGFNSGVGQADGKIVVVGAILDAAGNYDIIAARYDGENRDLYFNGLGWSRFHFGSGTQYATTVALQQDGEILVAGQTHDSAGFVMRVHAK
jgi:uncharacterized delta-60 repeat protein